MKQALSLLLAILTSSLMYATSFVYDFTTLTLSPSAMSIMNGSVSYNTSKGYYEVSNNANDTLSMTIYGVPNVVFKYWAETSKKAFKIKPGECIQLDGATRTLRISNLNINDIVTLTVASKGSSAANSFSGGLTNCTLYSGNITQAEYSSPLVYENVSFQATASTIEITNTAGGYCLEQISIGQNQSSNPQHSGSCGPNLAWALSNGVLTITGTGNMTNYSMMDPYAPSPWHSYSYDITRVIIDDGVTSIGNDAFSDCGLTTITIPNSVKSIGNYAFYGCRGLTSVTIPDSVISIGEGAFLGCNGLVSITVSNSLTSIGDYVFSGCNSLTSVTIPGSVTSIGRNAFDDCRVLSSVTIPGCVISIGDYAFDHCSVLGTVYCESSTPPQLGNRAFYNATSSFKIFVPCGTLEEYQNDWSAYSSQIQNLPSAAIQTAPLVEGTGQVNAPLTICDTILEAIPADGYRFVQWNDSCTDNPRIIDPEVEATYIAEFAKSDTCGGNLSWILRNDTLFISGSGPMTNWENDTLVPWHANHLTFNAVVINNGVSTIGDYAFSGDANLEFVSIPETVISIGECSFFGCSNLTYLSIPQSVTSIGNAAFAVSGLSSVAIPGNISSIANSTFFYCSGLSSLVIGTNVETIESDAFSGCSNLQTIICYNTTPPMVENNALQSVPNSAIVYVPIESVTVYHTHAVWGQFDVRPLNNTSLEDFPIGLALNEFLANPETQVFTLHGNDVTAAHSNLPPGIYILRLGDKTCKVTIP